MRKSISVNEVEDKWEKVPKTEFSDKQRRYFFAVGAMRQGKEDDGYVEVNYSKIPKKKSVEECGKVTEASGVFCPKCKSDNVFVDFVDDLCNCQSCDYSWYISSGNPTEYCFDNWDEKRWGSKPKKNPYKERKSISVMSD